jgi:hypothetical protein
VTAARSSLAAAAGPGHSPTVARGFVKVHFLLALLASLLVEKGSRSTSKHRPIFYAPQLHSVLLDPFPAFSSTKLVNFTVVPSNRQVSIPRQKTRKSFSSSDKSPCQCSFRDRLSSAPRSRDSRGHAIKMEGKALVVTAAGLRRTRIIKAQSAEDSARGPAAKPRPAGEMLKLCVTASSWATAAEPDMTGTRFSSRLITSPAARNSTSN